MKEIAVIGEIMADAADEFLGRGIAAVVHKRGAEGASYHGAGGTFLAVPFEVDKIDPTDAGDCFGGTSTSLWLQGVSADNALELAVASGAFAVTKRGPMGGTATLQELTTFIQIANRAA